MSRFLPSTPSTPTILHSTTPIQPADAHILLQSYLQTKDSSQPWSHSHDAGTTASLKKIALALRGLHGPAANHHFASEDLGNDNDDDGDNINMEDYNGGEEDIEDGVVSKVDTDEGGEVERRRVYETVEGLEAGESDEDGLRELQDVKRDELNPEEVEAEAEADGGEVNKTAVVDKEERKRLKKLRHKEEKRRKEAERREE
ncbi:hypothetical protein AA313_de0200949 [Arthrobotrys entomopaga]|nr:hypothetical protein AA313_de0200949 [Arthrobotrys entomopaga]